MVGIGIGGWEVLLEGVGVMVVGYVCGLDCCDDCGYVVMVVEFGDEVVIGV